MTMLQAIHHLGLIGHLSVAYPLQYWSAILALLLVVIRGWYVLGTMRQVVTCSPAPSSAPVRPRFVFYQRGQSVVLHIANLLFLGQIVTQEDGMAATIAVKFLGGP